MLAVVVALSFAACDDDTTVAPPPPPAQLSLTIYNTANGLPNNDVYDIMVDSQGRTWFATEQGLGVLEGNSIEIINQANGLVHPNTRALLEFGGKIYIGLWGGGVTIYDDGNWKTLTTERGLISSSVMSIAADDTSLYFATPLGVQQYKPSTDAFVKRFTALLPRPRWTATNKRILANVQISSVVPIDTPRGPEIWMGAIYGYITIWRPNADDFITYTPENSGLPGEMINDMLFNQADGRFWIATSLHGIAAVDVPNSTWWHFDQLDGLPSSVIQSIAVMQDGTIWAATNEGIAKQDGNGFVGYGVASGLPTERVRRVYVDPQDNVWFGFVEGGAAKLN